MTCNNLLSYLDLITLIDSRTVRLIFDIGFLIYIAYPTEREWALNWTQGFPSKMYPTKSSTKSSSRHWMPHTIRETIFFPIRELFINASLAPPHISTKYLPGPYVMPEVEPSSYLRWSSCVPAPERIEANPRSKGVAPHWSVVGNCTDLSDRLQQCGFVCRK